MQLKPTLLLPALLLCACGSSGVPRDDALSLIPGTNAVQLTAASPRTVKLPQATWTLSALPEWLSAAQETRSGMTYVTLSAQPLVALESGAQQQTLSTAFDLTSARGTYRVTVTAPLTRLKGTVTASATQSAAQALSLPPATPGKVVVQWKRGDQPGLSAQALTRQELGDGTVTEVREVPDVRAALEALATDARVWRAFPETRMRAAQSAFAPGDALADQQWQLPRIGYGKVLTDHTEAYRNAVTVAVVDTGIRADHPDLAGVILGAAQGAADLISDPANGDGDGSDPDPTDPGAPGGHSHGTAVAGIIAARHNAAGILGGAVDAPVKVLPIRVLGSGSDGDTTEVMLAVRYAAGETVTVGGKVWTNPSPARVINLSLGESGKNFTDDQKAFICDAVHAATLRGALVVAASGNSGVADAQYPAACPDALAVASVTVDQARNWVHAAYSASGPHVRISAPGGALNTSYAGVTVGGQTQPDGVLTTNWTTGAAAGDYTLVQGTSFATPQVSAVAALMLSKGVTQTGPETAARLLATATDVLSAGQDDLTGAGVVNAAAALGLEDAAVPTPTPGSAVRVEITAGSGRQFTPPVDSAGTWSAYLPGGSYRVALGVDATGDGHLTGDEVQRASDVTLTDGVEQSLP